MDSKEFRAALARFTRGYRQYRHWSGVYHYTAGVAFVAKYAGAEWLLDHIAARQKLARKAGLEELQIWTLRRTGAYTGRITCSRAKNDEVFHDDVTLFSGFPVDEVTLCLRNDTLMLPGER